MYISKHSGVMHHAVPGTQCHWGAFDFRRRSGLGGGVVCKLVAMKCDGHGTRNAPGIGIRNHESAYFFRAESEFDIEIFT